LQIKINDELRNAHSSFCIRIDDCIDRLGVNENAVEVAKEALKRGSDKVPMPSRIIFKKLKTS